jgi:signal transduction histidine kinase
MKAPSFRTRIALTMSLLTLAISAAMAIYLPRRFEREAMALLGHKAETLAQLTAFTIHPAIHFRDQAALEEALGATRRDRDVEYVIVVDEAGKTLSAFHPERAFRAGSSRLDVVTPIRDEGREIARLHLGISPSRVQRELRQMRIGIGVLTAVILGAGLAAAFLLSNVVTRPLRQLSSTAGRIAAGDLDQRVPPGRGDEIGRLADAFNDMATRIAERDASLRQLSRRLLSIQEEERIRIAREIHDELGQALTAMKIDLQHGEREKVARRIDEVVDLVRRIATDLRPGVLDDLGITAALEQQLRRVRESSGITTRLTVEEEPRLDTLTGATLYRIAQEALTNVVRHSGATEVDAALTVRDGAVVLEIRDNGKGIAAEDAGSRRALGLVGMRERAELLGGSVEVRGNGGGTTVTAVLPLPEENDARTLR